MHVTRTVALLSLAVIATTGHTATARDQRAHRPVLVRRGIPQNIIKIATEIATVVAASTAFNISYEKCKEITGYKEQATKEKAQEVVKAIQACEANKK
ncbi:hypothetical protein IWQ60_012299 [Tieghemiomyces parasiticus]|uniref:Uncharacterized protein n=1 Tax=Tieghemiomyces parasiticus TaxID=78921 RepID=A0A9W8DKV3_9FUNG|nr:hypothetical protein IWQ60_012299 [Tieghemiomyces parasiticus]